MAIGALLDDPVRRAELGAAGLDRARSRFSWDRVAERYEQILLAAVARC
jgi:glycosyltransferase involved in cell wall biosynthesis